MALKQCLLAQLVRAKVDESGDSIDTMHAECVKDTLDRLEGCNVTTEILIESKIGKVVSKLRRNAAVGSQAKALIKKWRKLASETPTQSRPCHVDAGRLVASGESRDPSRNDDSEEDGLHTLLTNLESFRSLDNERKKVIISLLKTLKSQKKSLVQIGMKSNAIDNMLVLRCVQIELEMYTKFKCNKGECGRVVTSLCNNLQRNDLLAKSVVLGVQVLASDLVAGGGKIHSALISSNVEPTVPSEMNRSRIMFFSRSRHAYPGNGASELLQPTDGHNNVFDELNSYIGFRQKLSNFYEIEPNGFNCAGRSWRTVEHCFQGRKFEDFDTAYCSQFALDSGSLLSRSNGRAARRAGGKGARPLTHAQLAAWDRRKHQVMMEAIYARYSQDEESRDILLATKNAVLLHRPPRSKLVVARDLMLVRDMLQVENGEDI